ncbi:hypothetical protein PCANB_002156 [Pneumocystis canis]|nr:hypothetical protein PCANB_002156 [Pneumocystis canis]
MKTSYKLQKEAFISGHTGQSVKEIAMIIGVIMSMHFLSAAFQSRRSNETYRFYYFLIEYGIYYMVPLFFVTFFASHLMLLILLLSFSTLILLFCTKPQKTDRDVGNKPLDFFERSLKCVHDAKNSDLKSYVTIFRGTIMLITCVAILAVDFRIFPRRFSKVETWGISLMDLGVGFFVFSSGIVAIKNIKKNYSDRNTSFMKKMMISLKQSYMFFVIGFIRIFITKMANYPEHVTEYGVHWNFFFTLGFLSLSLVFIEFLRHYLKSYIIIIALLSVYNELLIGSSRIVTYVLDAPRTNLISANKEDS